MNTEPRGRNRRSPSGPVHVHDCTPAYGCRFLGSVTPPPGHVPDGTVLVDLWVHRYHDRPGQVSAIYRWSSDGPDYESLPYGPGLSDDARTVVEQHPLLGEVLRRMDRADH